jgi:signal transduction histidine kinase
MRIVLFKRINIMLYLKYSSELDETLSVLKSDPLISALFNDAPDAIFVLDSKDLSIIDCNNKSLEIFEAETKSSLINLSSFRLYESEPVEFSKHLTEKNIKNAGEHTQELTFRTLNQNIFWGRLKKRSITINEKVYILLRITKVVDYLSTEETLSTLLRGTSQVTGNMFLKEFSKLLCRTFNAKYSIIGKLSADKKRLNIVQSFGLLPENIKSGCGIQNTIFENVVRGYTTFYPSGIKELFPEDSFASLNNIEGFMGTPMYGNSGEVMGILAFMNDKPLKEVTNSRYILSIFAARTAAELQRIRSKEILKEQTRELATSNTVKDKLLSVISQDLINPLHNVIAYYDHVRLNSKVIENDKIINRFEIIDNSLKNIFFTLENLSEWSRIYREPIRPRVENISIKETIEQSLSLYRYLAEIKNLKIDLQLENCPMLSTDKHMFNIIVRNVISNAVKFNKNFGLITVICEENDFGVILKIKDTGIGMLPAEIKAIMKANRDIPELEFKRKNSCGLGLVLTRNFIERLSGKVEIESTPDVGTAVIISLPKILK